MASICLGKKWYFFAIKYAILTFLNETDILVTLIKCLVCFFAQILILIRMLLEANYYNCSRENYVLSSKFCKLITLIAGFF